MVQVYFGVVDCTIFILFLISSLAIGAYFIFFGKKVKTAHEYFYGSKEMKAIPVGLSLYSSAMAALAIMGIPVEIYNYGTEFIMIVIGIIIALYLTWILILPIFCANLNIKTPYEYFERRFDNNVKLLSLLIYILHSTLLMPVLFYVPSLVISEVTHSNVMLCTITMGGICILYTTFGGFKTVIWTDSLQATLMLLSCLWVAISGVQKAGGFSKVWDIAQEGNRIIFFNMDPNPFVRTSFWSAVIGFTFIQVGHSGISAAALQRYMSLPSEKQARISTCIGALSTILVVIIMGMVGLAMYAVYETCDPVMNKQLGSHNQMLLYFITQTLDYIPGFCGFFIAALLSASLSTISSDLNIVSGIIYYDFLLRFYKNNEIIKNRDHFIIRLIVFITGIIYLVLVPWIQNNNNVFQFTVALTSITYGAKVGIMLLGLLFPKSNSKGAIIGAITSIGVIGWINFSAKIYEVDSYYILPTRVDNCSYPIYNTSTFTPSSNTEKMEFNNIFILYRMSYLYYCFFGTIITLVVGNLVSYMTDLNNMNDIDPRLIAPFLRSYIKKNQESPLQ